MFLERYATEPAKHAGAMCSLALANDWRLP